MNDCSQNLGPRLRYLNNRITQYMDQQFLALDLTSTQSFILHHLSLHEQEAVYPKDLEKRFHLTHPTVSGVLQRLEAKNFIIIEPDKADRRCKRIRLTAYPDGEACAELMLVVGTDEGGLPHPDWQENLANALKLQALLNRSAPGLCRDLDLRTELFNQHETPGSLLVEVGASGNTLAEALRSARILANALVTLIRGEEA